METLIVDVGKKFPQQEREVRGQVKLLVPHIGRPTARLVVDNLKNDPQYVSSVEPCWSQPAPQREG